MTELEITIRFLLSVAAAIATIGGAAKVIALVFDPWKRFKADFKTLETRVGKLETDFGKRAKTLDEIKANGIMSNKALFVILESLVSGNNTHELKQVKEELQDYFISR